MTRRAFLIREKKIVCFWSPKAGNTSLGQWLTRNLWTEEHAASGLEVREFLEQSGRTIKGLRRSARLVLQKGFESYALVRHPYTRATSAYVNKFLYNDGKAFDQFDKLEHYTQRFVQRQLGGPSDDAYRGVSFIEYLKAVVNAVRSADGAAEPNLNTHWNTQVPFLFREMELRYHRLIRLENIAEEIAELAERLEIVTPFPHHRSRPTDAQADRTDLSEVSSLEIIGAGLVPTDDSLLTPQARALLDEAYAIDFIWLGYEHQRA